MADVNLCPQVQRATAVHTPDKHEVQYKWSASPLVRWSKVQIAIALIAGFAGWYLDSSLAMVASAILLVIALFSIVGALVAYVSRVSGDEHSRDEQGN